jgi:hypothetical protein
MNEQGKNKKASFLMELWQKGVTLGSNSGL